MKNWPKSESKSIESSGTIFSTDEKNGKFYFTHWYWTSVLVNFRLYVVCIEKPSTSSYLFIFFATCDHVSMMFNLVALKYNGRAAINSLVLAFNCRSYFLYHRYIYLFIYIHIYIYIYTYIYSLIMIIPSKALRIYTLTIF